jgi:23S rRNA (guanosine2251-2'-O)-methyltransferase
MTTSLPFPKKTMEELNRLSTAAKKEAAPFPIVLLLDDVRSMHNVGSAFRTADAFNISAIHLCGYTPRPPHRDIHKTALGATETVPWVYQQDIILSIQELREQGYQVWAVEQTHNSTYLQHTRFDPEDKVAFIFGNEVNGVSNDALALCDGCIEIPQWGSKHSLNLSGVVLWELVKRRGIQP